MISRVTITCAQCGKSFKERPPRIRAGAILACLVCQSPLKIDAQSENGTIRKALSTARKIRMQAARAG